MAVPLKTYLGCQNDLHQPTSNTRTYQTDDSGEKTYEFNSLGFRGPEFDPNADITVYVCGCSMTFGIGLDQNETWPAMLAGNISDTLGASVSCLNMAQGGASNDYVVRTLISQLSSFLPDMVVANFTYMNRKEYNSGSLCGEFIGPWNKEDYSQYYYAYYELLPNPWTGLTVI